MVDTDDIECLVERIDEHEKKDDARFNELTGLIRGEVGKLLVAIRGDENTGGLRSVIETLRESMPHNARDRILTLEQLVPKDLPVVLSNLVTSERNRASGMGRVWASIASLGVVVAGTVIALLIKMLVQSGVTP